MRVRNTVEQYIYVVRAEATRSGRSKFIPLHIQRYVLLLTGNTTIRILFMQVNKIRNHR